MTTDYGSFAWCFLCHFAVSFNIDPTVEIVGYDPQKLLPDNRSPIKRWADTYVELYRTDYPEMKAMVDLFFPKDLDLDKEYIDFDKPIGTPTCRVKPIKLENVRLSYPSITEKRQGYERGYKMRLDEIDADTVVRVTDGMDFGRLEARILASLGLAGEVVLVLDPRGGVVEGNPQLDLYRDLYLRAEMEKPIQVATASVKRDMGYLKHDPTKRHKRSKRK